jgi:crossover junction endodeoxyribonuclease RuvC
VRILGIDPGLQTTGFGVVDVAAGKGSHISYVASGTIKTIPSDPLPLRLKTLFEGVTEVVLRYQPQAAAVEIVFVNINPQATLLLGQARGACLSALVATPLSGGPLTVAEYTALQLKQAVVGYGKAKKEQVQQMVARLLRLPSPAGPDASDALGLAICHAHAGQALARLAAAKADLGPSPARKTTRTGSVQFRSGRRV